MSLTTDTNDPIKIANNIYWVGKRSNSDLECNTYLRVFEGNGSRLNLLIDPGPSQDFSAIAEKVLKIIGTTPLHLIYLSHADPDVCVNAVYFQKQSRDARVIASNETWNVAKACGLEQKNFIPVENFKENQIKLNTGHTLKILPTPFVHAAGACALYDEENHVLFSGDLLGGFSNGNLLFNTEENWNSIAGFHRQYMPSQPALQRSVALIKKEAADAAIIAPHYGKLTPKELIAGFLEKMGRLPVGLEQPVTQSKQSHCLEAINEILERYKEVVGNKPAQDLIDKIFQSKNAAALFTKDGNRLSALNTDEKPVLAYITSELCQGTPGDKRAILRGVFKASLTKWNIKANVVCPDEKSSTAKPDSENFQNELDDILDELLIGK